MINYLDRDDAMVISGSYKRVVQPFIKNSLWWFLTFFSSIMFASFYYSLHALDRKYMFLICNTILAFLVNTLKFGHSSFTYSSLAEDVPKQVTVELLPPEVQEKLKSLVEQEEDHGRFEKDNSTSMAEQEHLEEEDHGGESEAWEDELEEGRAMEAKELPAIDARVNAEELNKKFEEFIRKMKEEIRIEAQ